MNERKSIIIQSKTLKRERTCILSSETDTADDTAHLYLKIKNLQKQCKVTFGLEYMLICLIEGLVED